MYYNENVNRAGKTLQKILKFHSKSLPYYEMKQHDLSFYEECSIR
jgi:hypothetical protein